MGDVVCAAFGKVNIVCLLVLLHYIIISTSYVYVCVSVQFSHSVVSNSLQPHGLQHTRPPCSLQTSGAYSDSWPLSW